MAKTKKCIKCKTVMVDFPEDETMCLHCNPDCEKCCEDCATVEKIHMLVNGEESNFYCSYCLAVVTGGMVMENKHTSFTWTAENILECGYSPFGYGRVE